MADVGHMIIKKSFIVGRFKARLLKMAAFLGLAKRARFMTTDGFIDACLFMGKYYGLRHVKRHDHL